MSNTVSVAVCTFNGERFIRRQMEGILQQTRPASQIVISDDGSTDATLDIVAQTLSDAEYANGQAPDVLILRNERPLGVTRNFEQALRHSTGDFVALCDQDDEWESDKLESMARAFESSTDLLFLYTDALLIDDNSVPAGGTLFGVLEVTPSEKAAVHARDGFPVFLRRNLATGAASMIRRSLVDVCTPFPAPWVQDEWLAIQAAARGGLDFSERRLTRYRRHSDNQIGAGDPTLRHKLGRVLSPRGDRNRLLAERSRILSDSLLHAAGVSANEIALANGKAAFEEARAKLPDGRIRRFFPVLRLAVGGGYPRYASRRWRDVVRDLLQPA